MINLLEEKQPEFQRVILWHTKNKYALYSAYLLIIWRRRGDSNPRWDIIPNTLSRRAT